MRQLKPGERLGERPVVSIGTFDGVHRGHQALWERARHLAQERGTSWVVLTFDLPPSLVLRRGEERFEITPLAEKLELMSQLDVPLVGVLQFDRALSRLPPEAFLNDVVGGWLNAGALVEGDNFTFGAGARGNPVTLRAWGERHGVQIDIVPPRGRSQGGWSSTRVREAIRAGHLKVAERILGRPVSAFGAVVPGDGRGRELGVPTANLELPRTKLMPPAGVYAGWLRLASSGVSRPSVANWGTRPTFDGQEPRLEVHVLDWPDAPGLTGETVSFVFAQHLRGIVRFDSAAALVRQIQDDIRMARELLDRAPVTAHPRGTG